MEGRMKTTKEYGVITEMVIMASSKDDSLIFKKNGRIYFVDKKFMDGYDKLTVDMIGEKILVWVTKEIDKVGFIRLTITGLPIDKYINVIKNYTSVDYFRNIKTDEVYLSNDIYNHDGAFKLYSEREVLLLGGRKKVSEHFDNVGINSEDSEFTNELIIAHQYLIDMFL